MRFRRRSLMWGKGGKETRKGDEGEGGGVKISVGDSDAEEESASEKEEETWNESSPLRLNSHLLISVYLQICGGGLGFFPSGCSCFSRVSGAAGLRLHGWQTGCDCYWLKITSIRLTDSIQPRTRSASSLTGSIFNLLFIQLSKRGALGILPSTAQRRWVAPLSPTGGTLIAAWWTPSHREETTSKTLENRTLLLFVDSSSVF